MTSFVRPAVVPLAANLNPPLAPLPGPIRTGPARFARLEINTYDDLRGICHCADDADVATRGWTGLLHMGIFSPDCDALRTTFWAQIVSQWPLLTVNMPRVEHYAAETVAYITRDAIAWILRPNEGPLLRTAEEMQAFGRLDPGHYWPMIWLRPLSSGHQRLERAQRLHDDLAFLTTVVDAPALDPTPLIL